MWLPAFAAVVLILVYYIQQFLKCRTRMQHLKKLPGTKPTFLIGNIGWIFRMKPSKLKHEIGVYIMERIMGWSLLFQKEGMYCFWVFNEPVVSIASPDLFEIVFSSNTSLEKSFEYTFLHRWLGLGLLTSTGQKWRSRRKLLTPCFHFRILEDFLPTFNDQTMVLVKKLQTMHQKEYVDIMPLVILCTLDIVCETVMGAQIGAQKGENLEYVNAIHNLGEFFMKRTVRPWLWYEALFRMTKVGRDIDNDLHVLHSFTQKVIREKKNERLSQGKSTDSSEAKEDDFRGKKRQALMDLLLDLHLNGQQLTEDDIKEEVDTFMFEGHDTTAMGITFALYCIGLYPKVQEKIEEELNGIFGDDHQRLVTMDDARNMKYLECTLKEAQRLYPSVPMIGRKLNEDVKHNGYVIPKDTTVHCLILSMHRRNDLYPNAEVFDPERFLPENTEGRHPYAYVPFSAGPRNCIGQKFALLEEKVVISNILRHFKVVSLDPRDQFHLKMEFTLRPAQPVRLKLIPRR